MAHQLCRGLSVPEELGWIDVFVDGGCFFVPVTL